MRTSWLIAIVAGCALLAGCDSGVPVSGPANSRPAPPASTAPASTATSAASTGTAASAAARCRTPAPLPAGAVVQPWRLGAIHFISPAKGLALTAPQVECDVPLGRGQGTDVYFRTQPVRLATTTDGGRDWVTSGTELPAGPRSPAPGQVVAVAGARVWVVAGNGELLVTGDAGATWAAQPPPAPVVAAGSAGGWLWALSCPPPTDDSAAESAGDRAGVSCQPRVERMRLPAGTWETTLLGPRATGLDPQLDVLSAAAAVLVLPGAHPELVSTANGGARWTVRAVPAGPRQMCHAESLMFTAATVRDWWLLCTGGAAAGSSAKALMRSVDAGRTWTVAASVPSLTAPLRPDSLNRQDASAIAAGTPEVLWLATPNTLTTSTDGGVTWRRSLSSEQGTLGQFDVRSGTDAWLLAPNAGLWRTTDGITWRPVGAAAPRT